ncbi:hypothetical protein BDN71DRAFT_1428287 [Pleurotus eryngii]|uniref:Uncharacterized protein n=1 Tax=Pleurotus eryngii TaxID=5323 RepID=A0A9P6DAG9_PLEER|nr:hypothetical protein BDN71DRAFT_1428287 [Pleurotus eryngii]
MVVECKQQSAWNEVEAGDGEWQRGRGSARGEGCGTWALGRNGAERREGGGRDGARGEADGREGEAAATGAAEGLGGDPGGGECGDEVCLEDELEADDGGGGQTEVSGMRAEVPGMRTEVPGVFGDTGDWVGLRQGLVRGLGRELGGFGNQARASASQGRVDCVDPPVKAFGEYGV